MQEWREKFPVVENTIYANTAATGLLNKDLFEWRRQHDLKYLNGGSDMKQQSFEHMLQINAEVGTFFNCKKENVALTPNFTLGLNLLLEGMPQNKKVLLLQNDYPSLNWGFETRNFDRTYVEINSQLEEQIYDALKKNTYDVLALSLVQWLNGIKISFSFLKQLKAEFPNLIIIADGTQYCGAERFDFEASGIDVLGASAYKWLLAGYGNGFLLVKDQVKEQFDLKVIGNGSVDRDSSKRASIPFCKLLEPGHLDSLNFGSLQFALQYLNNIGLERVENHLKALSKKAVGKFSELGLLEANVVQREEHTTIFNIRGDKEIYNKLRTERVVCVQRGEGIRLSFHLYNTENEIDAISDILKSC